MLNLYEYESKNEEELLEKCLKDLKLKEEDIIYRTSSLEGSLFKAKKYILYAVKKEEINTYIKEYISNLSKLMNININVEIREEENIYNIKLISDNNPILIGKDGRTINAIQLLLRKAIEVSAHQNIKVNVDVANYKGKQTERLEKNIRTIAEEIEHNKIDVSLDPMNSYDRRIVHCIISEYKDLSTESTGEGPTRHVVIKYVGE